MFEVGTIPGVFHQRGAVELEGMTRREVVPLDATRTYRSPDDGEVTPTTAAAYRLRALGALRACTSECL